MDCKLEDKAHVSASLFRHGLANRKPSINIGGIITEREGPAARRSKANKEARLVERKVCFILRARTRGGGQTPVQRPTPPHWQSEGKSFYRWRERATCRNSTGSSDGHLAIGHAVVWSGSDLDCFTYSMRDLSSPTRDRTRAPYNGSVES